MQIRLIIIFSLCSIGLTAQESWSLRKCIETAVANNIQLKQSDLQVDGNKIQLRTAKAARYPNLNGSTSISQSYGRRIDPTTNSFNNQTFTNQSYNLSSQVTLFNFNRLNNSIRQNQQNVSAANYDKAQLINDISLQVAQTYLNAMVAKENLAIARQSLEQTNSQLTLTDKLIDAGLKNRNSRLEIVAQQARNETDIITAENQLAQAMLDLKLLMQIDPNTNMDVQVPSVTMVADNPDMVNYEALFNNAYSTQPKFAAYKERMSAAFLAEKIANTNSLPSIVAQGSFGTNYSSLDQKVIGSSYADIPLRDAKIDLSPVNLTIGQNIYSYGKNPYFSQLDQNIGFGIGLGLNIPIYNNYMNKAAVQNAKINTENIKLEEQSARQNLRTEIMQALNNARAAMRTFQASQKAAEAMQGAYTDTQKRFEIGAANTFELISSKNNLDNASRTLIISKYQYLFSMKVLDYYAGKQLEL